MTGNYYPWFKKIINVCIYLFFVCAFVSTFFVFGSVFNGIKKYIIVSLLAIIYTALFLLFKKKIKIIINKCISKLEKVSFKKLLIVIIISSIVLKVVYMIFFYFDSTKFGGDITIYSNLADEISKNGISSVKNNIYYLVGFATHLSVFHNLGIPYHYVTYLAMLLGTIINYFSFSYLIGKEKSFILTMMYIIMPSTCMLSFCITHELFVYLYFSIILFLLSKFFISNNKLSLIYGVLLLLFISLNQTVSPIGKIWYIVLFLLVALSNIKIDKKIILCIVLVGSMILTNFFTTRLEGNNISQTNNYEQLLIGCNYESMGRHTDGRGKQAAKKYWESKGIELTQDNLIEGEKNALIEEYKYLLTHPIKLCVLLANKFYTVWSGDYYSIEYGHACSGVSQLGYYCMLVISALIWLFMMTIGIVYYDNKVDNICILNYKLIVLGIMSVLLIVEVTNKYSCYMTLFIYFVAFTISKFKGEENV